MCIACEMSFWDMVEALPQDARERVLREEAARQAEPFACDVPATVAPSPDDERKSKVIKP